MDQLKLLIGDRLDKLVAQTYNGAAVTNESRKRQCEDNFTKVKKAKDVCGTIILECQERFKCTAHLKASKLLQLSNVSNFIKTEHFSTLSLKNCVKAYPMFDQEKLRGELMLLYCWQDLYPSYKLLDLLHSLSSDQLRQDVFPELIKLLKIVLTIPMTTAKPERCFSTLKRIKTFLQSTMDTDRLSALAMILIAADMTSEIKDFDKKLSTTLQLLNAVE